MDEIDNNVLRFLSIYCRNDKLILKVKDDSDALLMLAGLMPSHVSQNAREGTIECKNFFPDRYRNDEEVEESEEVEEIDDGNEIAEENEDDSDVDDEIDGESDLNVDDNNQETENC